MKILLVKTSSMGDVLHTLPALTDAGKIFPNVRFDWVIEEALTEIPSWHPLVNKIIPVAVRRWRKNFFAPQHLRELQQFWRTLRQQQYDMVIDAQGLLKSALITRFARGTRCGFDRSSIRDTSATWFYQYHYPASWQDHAVSRVRQLFAAALHYPMPLTSPDYGVDRSRLLLTPRTENPFIVFLHGTTWATKHWPETYWRQLAEKITQAGLTVKIPWGNSAEYERAVRIASVANNIEVLPKLNLAAMAALLVQAKAAVAVDTGLGHLAAALSVPTISLYGPTNSQLTGAIGANQIHLQAQFACAPCLKKQCSYMGERAVEPACFGVITPDLVWQKILVEIAVKL